MDDGSVPNCSSVNETEFPVCSEERESCYSQWMLSPTGCKPRAVLTGVALFHTEERQPCCQGTVSFARSAVSMREFFLFISLSFLSFFFFLRVSSLAWLKLTYRLDLLWLSQLPPLLPSRRKQQHYSSTQQHSFEGPDVITLLASAFQFLYKASMS